MKELKKKPPVLHELVIFVRCCARQGMTVIQNLFSVFRGDLNFFMPGSNFLFWVYPREK